MDYTDFHFSAEEKLQKEYQYPKLEEEGPSEAFAAAVKKNVLACTLSAE